MSVALSALTLACWHPPTTRKLPERDLKFPMINLHLLLAEYLPEVPLSVMISLLSQRASFLHLTPTFFSGVSKRLTNEFVHDFQIDFSQKHS